MRGRAGLRRKLGPGGEGGPVGPIRGGSELLADPQRGHISLRPYVVARAGSGGGGVGVGRGGRGPSEARANACPPTSKGHRAPERILKTPMVTEDT
ncbi:hypothetical protein GCM10009848_37540 [Micromonospora lupini]